MSQVLVCCIVELGPQLGYVMTLVLQFLQFGCVVLNVLFKLQTQELDVNSTRGVAVHVENDSMFSESIA